MLDLQIISNYLKLFTSISLADITKLYNTAQQYKIAQNNFWIKEGDSTSKIAYIKKGLIRAFCIDDNGNEKTTIVREEHQFIASYDKILFDKPSKFYYQAVEETTLLVLDYDKLQIILKDNPHFEKARTHFLKKMLGESLERIENFILLTPPDRYKKFITENNSIYQRLPDKYIASILGITPVSLSRIKKRISKQR
jgi:CRP-like cAMP-binding protein